MPLMVRMPATLMFGSAIARSGASEPRSSSLILIFRLPLVPTICQPSSARRYIAIYLNRRRFAAVCGDKIKIECCLLAGGRRLSLVFISESCTSFPPLLESLTVKLPLLMTRSICSYGIRASFLLWFLESGFGFAASSACNFAKVDFYHRLINDGLTE